ncbi:MAG TPA: site-specific integrase [Magnetospirillum sp.]|nr:site-specific integrase [Magnetospirillum sp.]
MTTINQANADGLPGHSVARSAITALPALPSNIRYLDEYEDEWRTIRHPSESNLWTVAYDTISVTLDFQKVSDNHVQTLLKHFFTWMLQRKSPSITHKSYFSIMAIYRDNGASWFLDAVQRPLHGWQIYWNTRWRAAIQQSTAHATKLFLYFMCEMCLGDFRPVHIDFVRSLPFDWNDNYQGVISGESILTADEEAKLIEHLDDVTERVAFASDEELAKACLLCISYQHGLRPVQISRLNLDDLRIYPGGADGPLVHFLAYRAKKRKASDKTAFVRKIKLEWAPLFVEYDRRRRLGQVWYRSETASDAKLFPFARARIVTAIGDTIEQVTGIRRTATDLRHSAAQRLADAGATVEEVAEFLGHSHADTSLDYFEASPTQAEKLNKALAISPIYSAIAEVARTRTIDKAALLGMPSDKQVGAVPHGVPIAGIGACDLGQSLCSKNPVLSCYTCRKFLPLNDADIHKEVLDKLRPVVRFFFDESLGDNQSPAFVQLKVTLETIQGIIKALGVVEEGEGHE